MEMFVSKLQNTYNTSSWAKTEELKMMMKTVTVNYPLRLRLKLGKKSTYSIFKGQSVRAVAVSVRVCGHLKWISPFLLPYITILLCVYEGSNIKVIKEKCKLGGES